MDMGDLDFDGKLELAMGVPGSDSFAQTRTDAGEVVILYGFGQSVPAQLTCRRQRQLVDVEEHFRQLVVGDFALEERNQFIERD